MQPKIAVNTEYKWLLIIFVSYCDVNLCFVSSVSSVSNGPDSSSGRASASGSGGRRFDPRPRHTKGVKNGTCSSLADARNKRVDPGRYKKAGKYLLRIFVMSHNSS